MSILRVRVRVMDSSIRLGQWVVKGEILRDHVRVAGNLILPASKMAKDKDLIRLDQWAERERI